MEQVVDPQSIFNTTNQDPYSNITTYIPADHPATNGSTGFQSFLRMITPAVNNPYLQDSLRFLFFGSILETGRRLWQWVIDKFTGGFVLRAVFDEGDQCYEWVSNLLNEEKVWSRAREFRVTARTTTRKWGVSTADSTEEDQGHAEYVPAYEAPQLFWWKGTCIQAGRYKSSFVPQHRESYEIGCIVLTLYTRKRSVLDDLIESARLRYLNKEKPGITVHSFDRCRCWCMSSTKPRRPMDSLILPPGVKEMLLDDAEDFLRSEEWYSQAGIQHKRGYLLYGVPGTGKSSTIHALAGELDLEIYALTLAADGLDDSALAQLVAASPANSIILIEDIDCAFPSREEREAEEKAKEEGLMPPIKKSNVTLSGLLNIIDGVSSEEGRLLFATTNHVDRIDPALLRPGRMDVKIHYTYSTREQVIDLFKRFYHTPKVAASSDSDAKETPTTVEDEKTPTPTEEQPAAVSTEKKRNGWRSLPGSEQPRITRLQLPLETVERLAQEFADTVPENKYTVAELQCYLLTVKTKPFEAVKSVNKWIEDFEEERKRITRKSEEEKRKEKEREKKARKRFTGTSENSKASSDEETKGSQADENAATVKKRLSTGSLTAGSEYVEVGDSNSEQAASQAKLEKATATE